jgi:hypothetical protein
MRVLCVPLLGVLWSLPGCSGGDKCGAETPAAAQTALLSVDGVSYSYGGFLAGANNDCPPDAGGPTSITVYGQQPGSGFSFVICLRKPTEIGAAPISLADTDLLTIFDVNALADDGCDYRLFPGGAATGTIAFDGFCTRPGATYNFTLDGTLQGIRRCPQDGGLPVEAQVTMALSGSVAVHVETEAGW